MEEKELEVVEKYAFWNIALEENVDLPGIPSLASCEGCEGCSQGSGGCS